MPVVYAKCSQGHENRKIIPSNLSQYKQVGQNKYRFDPTLPYVPDSPTVDKCAECDEELTFGEDPKSIASGMYFNWMEGY